MIRKCGHRSTLLWDHSEADLPLPHRFTLCLTLCCHRCASSCGYIQHPCVLFSGPPLLYCGSNYSHYYTRIYLKFFNNKLCSKNAYQNVPNHCTVQCYNLHYRIQVIQVGLETGVREPDLVRQPKMVHPRGPL